MSWVEGLKRLEMAEHRAELDQAAVLESFKWAGVTCVIGRGSVGCNGYVYLPRRVAWRLNGVPFGELPFEVNRELIMFGIKRPTVGFHTRALGDYWGFKDGIEYAYDKDVAEVILRAEYKHPVPEFMRKPWTIDGVRVVTRHLAEQVAQLNYVVPWRPEHRAMRRRLRSAKKGGDA